MTRLEQRMLMAQGFGGTACAGLKGMCNHKWFKADVVAKFLLINLAAKSWNGVKALARASCQDESGLHVGAVVNRQGERAYCQTARSIVFVPLKPDKITPGDFCGLKPAVNFLE